jgi:hypothetical protein
VGFTYDEGHGADRDRVRFAIGDTVLDHGPRPNNGNFSNEELNALLTEYGEWPCAVAAVFRALHAEWSIRPVFGPGELSTTHANVAIQHDRAAAYWSTRCADAQPSVTPVVRMVAVKRIDGYTDQLVEYSAEDDTL